MNPVLDETAGTGYQWTRDPAEIWLARQWQQILGFGQPPAMALPATAVQRAHECGTDGQLARALRELIG